MHQKLTSRALSDTLSPDMLRNLRSPTSDDFPKLMSPVIHPLVSGSGLDSCDDAITPDCLRALYNIDYKPISTDKDYFSIGQCGLFIPCVPNLTAHIVEYTPHTFLQRDLDLFFQNFSAFQGSTAPTLVSIDGGVVQTTRQNFSFTGESSLDLPYGMTSTNPQTVQLYQVGDLVEGGSFNNL